MAGQNISHEGHRQRMRARVEQYGLESLAPHEALEYLLYITNARRDTNGIAHALLERFGSFAGVLEASEEELCRVPGVGPASARMLHLLPEASRYYEHSRTSTEGALTTTERLAAYLKPRFAGSKQEKALLLSLDSRSRVKSVYWLKEGNSRMVSLEVKDVVSAALRGGTESVVLCHNHPNGVPLPPAKTSPPPKTSSVRWGWSRYACATTSSSPKTTTSPCGSPTACLSTTSRPAQCYAPMEENDLHHKIIVV